MKNELISVCIFLVSVLISSISQIMLKKSALRTYETPIKEYLNPLVVIAYILFFSSSLLTTFAYKGVTLSLGMVLESTGYIYIAFLGYFILHEPMSKRKIIGNLVIIFGILIFAFL